MKKKSNKTNFKLFSLISIILIFCFGLGAISIVWLRMEISSVAKNCGKLEGLMEVAAREVHELRAEKSRSLRPSTLALMVQGRLVMPFEGNISHVSALDMESVNKGDRLITLNNRSGGVRDR